MSPVGLDRFSTLRSWLSQCSRDGAHRDGVACGGDLTMRAYVIEITSATRHYVGPGQPRKAVDIVNDRLMRRELASAE